MTEEIKIPDPTVAPVEVPKKKHNTTSHANRILNALARIYENPTASVPEALQAVRLASEVLERRPTPRRKTDKEKMIERALGKSQSRPFGPKKKATPGGAA